MRALYDTQCRDGKPLVYNVEEDEAYACMLIDTKKRGCAQYYLMVDWANKRSTIVESEIEDNGKVSLTLY